MLTIWFDPAMTWEAAPTCNRRRQPDQSHTGIQTFVTIEGLFGMVLLRDMHRPKAIAIIVLNQIGRLRALDGLAQVVSERHHL